MAIVVRMPEVLAGAIEGVISRWEVSEGDEVSVGDILAEIETDKASVEYQAEVSGRVARLLHAPGASVQVGDPIAVFAEADDSDDDLEKTLSAAGGAPAAPAEESKKANSISSREEPAAADNAPIDAVPAAGNVDMNRGPGERVFASPIVRKLAAEAGVDLTQVPGTGPGGRIIRKDFDSHAHSAAARPMATGAAATPTVGHGLNGYVDIKHSSMRRAIARRLTESKSTIPHFYITADCMVDRLLDARVQLNEGMGIKTSVNDWVVKAVAQALIAVPASNVIWTDQAMRQFNQVDISVAVATEGGLYTPVIRGVNHLSIPQISAAIREMADKARSGSIKQEDIEGGSFAVNNLGMYGTEEFSAILNPPQSGILAVGAAREKPIAVEGQLQVAPVMTVTLSADHRAVDGALAEQWMAAFKKAIENPVSLLL